MGTKKSKKSFVNKVSKFIFQRDEKDNKRIKTYLFIYNTLQTLGWTFLLLKILQYYLLKVDVPLYEHIKWPLIIFQNAAALEIVHAILKFVKSNPVVTIQQVFSRVMLVCGVLIPTLDARESIGFPLMLLAWSLAEIIRYASYALNLINKVPFVLTWLRYSTFIVLYPIGITGELLCLYAAANEVARTKMWSFEFPNRWNVIFYYNHYLIFFMCLYVPLFPKLFWHMVKQRSKVLANPGTIDTSKTVISNNNMNKKNKTKKVK